MLGFRRKMRKRHAETTESSGKSRLEVQGLPADVQFHAGRPSLPEHRASLPPAFQIGPAFPYGRRRRRLLAANTRSTSKTTSSTSRDECTGAVRELTLPLRATSAVVSQRSGWSRNASSSRTSWTEIRWRAP